MTSPQAISKRLRSAVTQLNKAASEIAEMPLEPSRDHLIRIGEALSRIFEVQYHLNALDPSLTPPELKGPFENPDGALSVALSHAAAAESEGHIAMAIALLDWIAANIGSPKHAAHARREIQRLKKRAK